VKVRNWLPWDDLPLGELGERGYLLSDDTVTMIQAYLGVEDYVGDYVEDGRRLVNNARERRNLRLSWGMGELKHAESWELVLLHSGRRTGDELRAYREQVQSHTWTMREHHPGADSALGVVCYAMVQERATYFNYEEMRKRIRQEYGPPERPTDVERERGQQIGAADAFKPVGNDEIAHHGIFLELVKLHLRYLPHETLDMLVRVFNGFTMPALSLIPDASALAAALERTRIHTPLAHARHVSNPILDALGLKNRRALERAVQDAKRLPPELGPEHVAPGRDGEYVLSVEASASTESRCLPTGSLGGGAPPRHGDIGCPARDRRAQVQRRCAPSPASRPVPQSPRAPAWQR
jgi:acyl-[acyl-carrier-protein] desaturase